MADPTRQTSNSTAEADVPTKRYIRLGGLIGGIVLALGIGIFADLGDPIMTRTAAIAVLMAVWWITEALPLGATALLPLVLFPVLGIMDGKAVSREYGNWVIFLFIGGFLIALAMERWNLHRRIALNVLAFVGGRPMAVLLGFMAATAFLSMWISNTATTMMMVPIALAIMVKWEEISGKASQSKFASSLMLGIPYAASIGGVATLVGTPPNVALAGMYAQNFPDAPPIAFGRWMIFAVPLSLCLLAVTWVVLTLRMRGDSSARQRIDTATIRQELQKLGPMTREELHVLIAFASVALLWVFRRPLDLGALSIPGWSTLLPSSGFVNDGTVAIAVALLLFIVPSRGGGRLLDVTTFPKLPWGIVLLFGGGFALAAGFKESGLSLWVGERLAGLADLPLPILIGCMCLVITFLTEVTSNTASAQILLPILAGLSIQLDIDPLLLMVPGAISCSCAFMLPVATPPNAISFGTGRLSMGDMVKAGFILNLIGIIIVTTFTVLLSGVLMDSR